MNWRQLLAASSVRQHWRLVVFGGLLFLLVSTALWPWQGGTEELRIGDQAWQVELARTPEERSLGLGERSRLAPGRGMLFIFDPPTPATFWMRGMNFPLDIVFIRGGVVRVVERRIPPQSQEIFPSPGAVDAVLEVNAGEADGIHPGMTVSRVKRIARSVPGQL